MNATADPLAGTQSVRRAVTMLEAFTDERPSWSVSDLADHIALNRTTVYRLLRALEHAEYVHRAGCGVPHFVREARRHRDVRAVL